MEYEDERQAFTFIAGMALGTLIGAGVALLVAPQSGRRTRRQIARTAEDIGDTARERFGDAGDEVRRRAQRAKRAAERRGQRLRESIGKSGSEDDD
jgi:gas vesicle protein